MEYNTDTHRKQSTKNRRKKNMIFSFGYGSRNHNSGQYNEFFLIFISNPFIIYFRLVMSDGPVHRHDKFSYEL